MGLPRDRAGNKLRSARQITLSDTSASFQDWIGKTDRDDFYAVRLTARSSVRFSLTGLKANADVALLNGQGGVIQQSAHRGKQRENIQHTLDQGTYYVRVYGRDGGTHYRLTAVPYTETTSPNPLIEWVEVGNAVEPTSGFQASVNSSPSTSFNIQFDYRFDQDGWFTPDRRSVLESAAQVWESIIQHKFENVSAGTMLSVINPQTNAALQMSLNAEIDDLVIFVGTRVMDGAGGTVGEGGPSGYWIVGSPLDQRFNGSTFAPWTATLSFDKAESWFFDSTPNTATDIPTNQLDFFSVALHELGHTLGIGSSYAYNAWVHNGTFTGAKAMARNGGYPVPLTDDGHVSDGFIASGVSAEALMDPVQLIGSRKLPTNLDIALLEDMGYRVVYG